MSENEHYCSFSDKIKALQLQSFLYDKELKFN